MSAELPPCGLYRTKNAIADIPEGRLVYFHNHGDPGPGIYLPEAWRHNRASFARRGTTLEDLTQVAHLEAIAPEGLYRVMETFFCCSDHCRSYPSETLVQLGYNASADAILFTPLMTHDGLGMRLPERGQKIDTEQVEKLSLLKVAHEKNASDAPQEHQHTSLH